MIKINLVESKTKPYKAKSLQHNSYVAIQLYIVKSKVIPKQIKFSFK